MAACSDCCVGLNNNLVNNGIQNLKYYLDNIPKNTGVQAVKAFTIGFVIESVVSGNPVFGIAGGICSVTATAIHAAVTPLFKMVIGQDRLLTFHEEMLRGCIAIIGTCSLVAAFGNPVILNFMLFKSVFYAMRVANNPTLRSLDHASWLVVFPMLDVQMPS